MVRLHQQRQPEAAARGSHAEAERAPATSPALDARALLARAERFGHRPEHALGAPAELPIQDGPPAEQPASAPPEPVVQRQFRAGGKLWNGDNADELPAVEALKRVPRHVVARLQEMARSATPYFEGNETPWETVIRAAEAQLPWAAHVGTWVETQAAIREDQTRRPEKEAETLDPSHESAVLASGSAYGAHIASFLPLDLAAQQPRPTNPYEARGPDKYFRSQDEHPQLTIAGKKRGQEASAARRQPISTAWASNQAPKSKYEHSGPNLGHLGLRPSNYALLEERVTDERHEELRSIVPSSVTGSHPIPADEPSAEQVQGALHQAFTSLSEIVLEPPTGPLAYVPQEQSEQDARFSTSFVLRRLAQSNEMARQLVQKAGRLNNLTLEHNSPNPNVTVHFTALDAALQAKKADSETRGRIVEWLQAYFAGQTTLLGASTGSPLPLQIRQSFGFLDTTVANTAMSVRISLGREPPEYIDVLAAAIRQLDRDAGVLAEAVGRGEIPTTQGPWNTGSEEKKYAGVYRSILAGSGAILDFVKWVTTTTAPSLGKRNPDVLHDDRTATLGGLRQRAADRLREQIASARRAQPGPTELPIQEDLDDAAIFALHLLVNVGASTPTQAFPRTAVLALTRIAEAAAAALQALRALRERPGTVEERGQAHLLVRNAVDQILNDAFLLAAVFDVHRARDPQQEITNRVREHSGIAHATAHVTDSGEQALFASALAHQPAKGGASGTVDFHAHPDAYYELPNIRDALKPPSDRASTVRVSDFAGYRNRPLSLDPPRAEQPAPNVLDLTNTDPLSQERLEELGGSNLSLAAASLVKFGELGSDHLQQGLAFDLRPPERRTGAVPPVPLSHHGRQVLSSLLDLRNANEVPVEEYLGQGLDDPGELYALLGEVAKEQGKSEAWSGFTRDVAEARKRQHPSKKEAATLDDLAARHFPARPAKKRIKTEERGPETQPFPALPHRAQLPSLDPLRQRIQAAIASGARGAVIFDRRADFWGEVHRRLRGAHDVREVLASLTVEEMRHLLAETQNDLDLQLGYAGRLDEETLRQIVAILVEVLAGPLDAWFKLHDPSRKPPPPPPTGGGGKTIEVT